MLDGGDLVYSYVAIRADEEYREGYASKHRNLIVRLPLKDAGIDKTGVLGHSRRGRTRGCPNTTSGGLAAVAPSASSNRRLSGFA